jgi:hypothetical protein
MRVVGIARLPEHRETLACETVVDELTVAVLDAPA